MESFAEDIRKGLSAERKFLPSKYFYDAHGSKLFQAIMTLPEYYPTRCEFEILSMNKGDICDILTHDGSSFELVELGAGDGMKTKILLRCLAEREANFTYLPIDIDPCILVELTHSVRAELPTIRTGAVTAEYFQALEMLKRYDTSRRVILFLGSSIGNFESEEAVSFLSALRNNMNPDDLLIIGFDLQKNPRVIAEAYNDKAGVTRAFNLNLLHRINRELKADFDMSKFEHYPVYDPLTGEARSFLVSSAIQTVTIEALNESFGFRAGEHIHTEISKKYTPEGIVRLAKLSGFSIVKNIMDCRHYFTDSIWKVG